MKSHCGSFEWSTSHAHSCFIIELEKTEEYIAYLYDQWGWLKLSAPEIMKQFHYIKNLEFEIPSTDFCGV